MNRPLRTSSIGVGRRSLISTGAPHRQDLPAQVVHDLGTLRRRQVRVVLPLERLRNPHVFGSQRAPGDRRRMRGQHDLDPHRRDRRVQGLGPDAALQQPRERVGERSGLRRSVRFALVITPPADAVVLLGDVREREEMREGARHRYRHRQRQRPQRSFEGADRMPVTLPRRLRDSAHTLDRFEQRRSLRAGAACRPASRRASTRRPAAGRCGSGGVTAATGGRAGTTGRRGRTADLFRSRRRVRR